MFGFLRKLFDRKKQGKSIDEPVTLDFLTRLLEELGIAGRAVTTAVGDSIEPDSLDEVNEISTVIGLGIATLAASIWLAVRKWFTTEDTFSKTFLNIKENGPKLNIWSRRFKTAEVFGVSLGQFIVNFIPLSHIPGIHLAKAVLGNVLGSILGIVFGLIGIVVLSDNPEPESDKFFKLGKDGWTKYTKTGLVYGGSLGALIGFFIPIPGGVFVGMALGALIGNVAGFIISAVAVPLFNAIKDFFTRPPISKTAALAEFPGGNLLRQVFGKKIGNVIILSAVEVAVPVINRLRNFFTASTAETKPSNYRTNYTRAGIVIGSSLGGIIGTFLLPVIGTAAGAALGGAIGAVTFGLFFGIIGPFISRLIDPNNTATNSWDYGIRTGAVFGGNYGIGSILSAVVMPQFTAIAVAASTLVCAAIGGIREIGHALYRKWNNLDREPEKKTSIPWTQSTASGAVLCSAIGGLIGLITLGPLGGLVLAGACGLFGGLAAGLICSKPWQKKLVDEIIPEKEKQSEVKTDIKDSRKNSYKSKNFDPLFAKEFRKSASNDPEKPLEKSELEQIKEPVNSRPISHSFCSFFPKPVAFIQEKPSSNMEHILRNRHC